MITIIHTCINTQTHTNTHAYIYIYIYIYIYKLQKSSSIGHQMMTLGREVRHMFRAKASLPLTLSTPAVSYDITASIGNIAGIPNGNTVLSYNISLYIYIYIVIKKCSHS